MQGTHKTPELISLKEVSKIIGLSISVLRIWFKTKQNLRFVKYKGPRGRIFCYKDEVLEFVENSTINPKITGFEND